MGLAGRPDHAGDLDVLRDRHLDGHGRESTQSLALQRLRRSPRPDNGALHFVSAVRMRQSTSKGLFDSAPDARGRKAILAGRAASGFEDEILRLDLQ